MKRLPTVTAFISLLLLNSCATYHISTESLMKQFASAHEETKTLYFLVPPFIFFPGRVSGNSLLSIKVQDKRGNTERLWVNRHTGVRITENSGKRTTFYFNTLLLQDSTITGSRTHFFNWQIRPIRFADIRKIELQK